MATPVPTLPLRSYKGTTIFGVTEIEEIEKMDVRDDDIWVVSFPRSGTTLTQEIVYLIITNLDWDTAKAVPLDARFPYLDLVVDGLPHFRGLRAVDAMSSPRLIKSHLHSHLLPEQLFKTGAKVIYVMRNPKDTAVSCMFLIKFMQQADPNMSTDAFLEHWLNGGTFNGPWWRHVRDFWMNRHSSNILILSYEDLIQNMATNIRRIAGFLGKPLTTEQVQAIAEHCQFSQMKSNTSTNAIWIQEHGQVDKQFGGHIRQGKVGSWRDHFSPEMSERFDDMINDKLAGTGLQFQYGE